MTPTMEYAAAIAILVVLGVWTAWMGWCGLIRGDWRR